MPYNRDTDPLAGGLPADRREAEADAAERERLRGEAETRLALDAWGYRLMSDVERERVVAQLDAIVRPQPPAPARRSAPAELWHGLRLLFGRKG